MKLCINSKKVYFLIPLTLLVILSVVMTKPYIDMLGYKTILMGRIKIYYSNDQELKYVKEIESKLPVYKKYLKETIGTDNDDNITIVFKDSKLAQQDPHLNHGQNGYYYNKKITIRTGPVTRDGLVTYGVSVTANTFFHEYTHHNIKLYNKKNLPKWIDEGLAQYLARYIADPENLPGESLPFNVVSLDKNWSIYPTRSLYYSGEYFISKIIKIYGQEKLQKVLDLLAKGNSQYQALETGLDTTLSAFEKNMTL